MINETEALFGIQLKLISRYAKYYQEIGDIETRDKLYKLKTEGLNILYNRGILDISLYCPEDKTKYNYILCHKHKIESDNKIYMNDWTAEEYTRRNNSTLCKCKKCKKNKSKRLL